MAKVELQPLSRLPEPFLTREPQWTLEEMAGRLIEISEPHPIAALSFAFLLVQEVQTVGFNAAWVGSLNSCFYPPDVEKNGIDLRNFPVLRLMNTQDMARAAETLLRSSAFRLILLDLGRNHWLPAGHLSQLNGLTRKHNACVLFLTKKQSFSQSVSPLVSLHAQVSRKRIENGQFLCQIHVHRDKRRGRKWIWQQLFSGVDGYY